MTHGIAMGNTVSNTDHLSHTSFVRKQSAKTILKVFSCLLLLLFFISPVNAQGTKPAVFFSQIEMTPSGGQPYDEFYWLNSNNASLTKTGVNFPATGSYRCDISAYLDKGKPVISVSIDGVSKGNITVDSSSIGIFSVLIPNISAGTHTVTLQLTNFNSAANYGKVGLVYFTPTTNALPYVYPPITPLPFTPAVTMLSANHFGSRHLRGFSLGSNGSNQSGESDKSMKDLVATGANIVRCFVEIERPSGGTYQFKAGELTKLDTTVARGKRLGFYVVPVIFHDPSLNTDYWGNEARKSSIVNLWKTIASKYKGNPVIGAYDLINEPRSNFNYAECIRLQTDMIDVIRAIDPDHVVMVECIDNDMFAMMLPLSYTNVVYSPHGYSSIMITHQGVAGESSANVRDKYPTITSTSNLNGPWNKTQLSAQHDKVRIMTKRFHVPVFIGEFSCVNWAPMNDAGKWTSTEWVNDNITLLEAEGWSWVYHTWRGDYAAWEAEIPSSYYNKFTFSNATPQGLPSYSEWAAARSDNAPTIVMLKNWFALNNDTTTYYRDYDNDGYGSTTNTVKSATQPTGYVTKGGDCNESNATIHPGATEICGNGIDDNCNGQVDEGCSLIPSLTIDSVTVYESDGTATLNVSLSKVSNSTVSVSYSTTNGTAVRAEDYKATKGAIKIPAGARSVPNRGEYFTNNRDRNNRVFLCENH